MILDLYLPPGMTTQDIITAMSGVVAFLTIVLVWQALIEPSPRLRRIKQLAERRDALRAGVTFSPKRFASRQGSLDLMRRTVDWLKLMRGKKAQQVADRLAQAGWRSRDAIIVYLFMKVAIPVAFGVVALSLIYAMNLAGALPLVQLMMAGTLVACGINAPDLFVGRVATNRRNAIRKALPDALDLMVICAEAGLNLDAALARVARESAPGCLVLADELELTSIELGFLPERRTALTNLAKRTQLPSVRALINALLQSEAYGTPLSRALRVLSAEMRAARLMKAEEKAARLPAILTVPMVIFILPCLFIVLLGPGILDILDGVMRL